MADIEHTYSAISSTKDQQQGSRNASSQHRQQRLSQDQSNVLNHSQQQMSSQFDSNEKLASSEPSSIDDSHRLNPHHFSSQHHDVSRDYSIVHSSNYNDINATSASLNTSANMNENSSAPLSSQVPGSSVIKPDTYDAEDIAAAAMAAMFRATDHKSHHDNTGNDHSTISEGSNVVNKLQDTHIHDMNEDDSSLGQHHHQQQDTLNSTDSSQENAHYMNLLGATALDQSKSQREGTSLEKLQRLSKSFQDAENALDVVTAELTKLISDTSFGADPFLSRFNAATSFIKAAGKAIQDRVLTSTNYVDINMFDVYTSAVQAADLVNSDLSMFRGDSRTGGNRNNPLIHSSGINTSSSSSAPDTSQSSFQQKQQNEQNIYPLSDQTSAGLFPLSSRNQDQMFSNVPASNSSLASTYPPSFQMTLNSASQNNSSNQNKASDRTGRQSLDGMGNYRFINVSLKQDSNHQNPDSGSTGQNKNGVESGGAARPLHKPSVGNGDEDEMLMNIPGPLSLNTLSSGSASANYFLSNDGSGAPAADTSADDLLSVAKSGNSSRDRQQSLQYPYIPIASADDRPRAETHGNSSSGNAGSELSGNSASSSDQRLSIQNSPDAKKVYSSDGSEIPQYRMSRTIATLQEMVREWYEGLDGGPSVRQLEAQYGSKWRTKNDAERVFLGRRKVIINKIEESIRTSNGKRTFDDIVEEMENERKRLKKSIDGFGRYYNQLAAKEKQAQAVQQERATAAAVAAAVAAATAQQRVLFDDNSSPTQGMSNNHSTSGSMNSSGFLQSTSPSSSNNLGMATMSTGSRPRSGSMDTMHIQAGTSNTAGSSLVNSDSLQASHRRNHSSIGSDVDVFGFGPKQQDMDLNSSGNETNNSGQNISRGGRS